MIPSRTRCVRAAIARHRDPRIGGRHRRILLAGDVVPHEDAVPAGRLGLDGELDEHPGIGVSRTFGSPIA